MIRKSLFLFLTLALLSVPVFLMAHTFTHFAQIDVLDVAETETETESDEGVDLDEICLECLALTALNIILIAAGLSLSDSASRRRLLFWAMERRSDNQTLPYHSRAPPLHIL